MKKNILFFLLLFIISITYFNCPENQTNEKEDKEEKEDDDDDNPIFTRIVFIRATAWELSGETLYKNIFTMNTDGTIVQQITFGNNDYNNPYFSLDGTRILFTADTENEDSEIMVVNSFGLNPIQLTNNTIYDGDASFSYDGTKIVFIRATAWELSGETLYTNIFTMNSDGTNVQQITFGNNDYNNPYFSLDGTRILFTDYTENEDSEIMVVNSDGSNPIQLTNNTIYDSNASFSYDGTKIVFIRATAWELSGETLYTNIFTMNTDGTIVQQITFGNNDYNNPYFSLDGTRILFTADTENEDSEIMAVNSFGLNPIQLTNNTIYDGDASFYYFKY